MIDEAQFDALYREYLPQIFAYVSRRIPSRAQVEDVVSEIFMKVAIKLPQFDDRKASFKTWLYVIATNTLIDHLRSLQRHPTDDLEMAEEKENPDLPSPEQQAEQSERQHQIHRVIATLPEKHQKIIFLKYFSDLSTDEIAQTLDVSVNNASVMVHRALAAFAASYNRFVS